MVRIRVKRIEECLRDFAKKSISPIQYAITILLSRSELNPRWKILPEQRLCIEYADRLRVEAKEGRLKCIFCHVSNEGKRSRITATILKAMGLTPGAHDYWHIGDKKSVLIEFKRPDEPLPKDFKDGQKLFHTWAAAFNIPCYLCNDVESALNFLRIEGLLA